MPSIDLHSGWTYIFLCGVLLAFFSFMLWTLRQPSMLLAQAPSEMTAQPRLTRTPAPLRIEPFTTISSEFGTAWSRQHSEAYPATESQHPLEIHPPDCYPAYNQTWICLGWVRNLIDLPLEQVHLHAIWDDEGSQQVSVTTLVEQRRIRGGGMAPYRVYSTSLPAAGVSPEITLLSYRLGSGTYTTLQIQQEHGEALLDEGRYRLQAEIENPYDFAVPLVEAVVTLVDARGRITGYRVVRLPEGIAARTSQPILVDVLPVLLDHDVAHVLNVEAHADER